jgi:thiol-disulfide isomerase/thioredoxin
VKRRLNIRRIAFYLLIALIPCSGYGSSPEFTLSDLSGNPLPLSQYVGQGQWTVVVIWAEDCEICNAEIETLDLFHKQYNNKNARVLGVSIDGKDKITLARDFVKRHDLTFPNLIIEPEMSEILKFGGGNFIGTPTFYIYTPAGEIVASQAGAVPVHIIEDFIQNWKKP